MCPHVAHVAAQSHHGIALASWIYVCGQWWYPNRCWNAGTIYVNQGEVLHRARKNSDIDQIHNSRFDMMLFIYLFLGSSLCCSSSKGASGYLMGPEVGRRFIMSRTARGWNVDPTYPKVIYIKQSTATRLHYVLFNDLQLHAERIKTFRHAIVRQASGNYCPGFKVS
jgi:hypothetical protein